MASKTTAKKKTNVVSMDTKPRIEKGVPMPMQNKGQWAYLDKMEIGDSIFLNKNKYDLDKAVQSVRSWGYPRDIYFSSRCQENGVRIWRIK